MSRYLKRISPTELRVDGADLDVRVFANESVLIEDDAVEQLTEFLDVARVINDLKSLGGFVDNDAALTRVVLTPDFHKGGSIPIGTVAETRGFVVPAAIGSDICCGMRLLATDLPVSKLEPHWPEIQKKLRSLFFQGGRNIPLSPRQREAILRRGLPGLVELASDNAGVGIYEHFDQHAQLDDLSRVFSNGGFSTERLFGFEKFIESSGELDSRDPQIGCVGGGNHFVEIQRIEELICGATARELGITKGNLAIMVHAGSVALGHAVGDHFNERGREIFPRRVVHPKGGFFPLPVTGPHASEGKFYIDSMRNAANFAFANRLFLGLMVIRAIREVTGFSMESRLVYDAPHNLVFSRGDGFIHRKGATPAEGPVSSASWIGQPVIIPGSMGSSSYLLVGCGNTDALESACHGAGRAVTRGAAAHASDESYDEEARHLKIVTPIDPESPQVRFRRDIMKKYRMRIKEEAPSAYKQIVPIIDTVRDAGIARPVARMVPLCTVKG